MICSDNTKQVQQDEEAHRYAEQPKDQGPHRETPDQPYAAKIRGPAAFGGGRGCWPRVPSRRTSGSVDVHQVMHRCSDAEEERGDPEAVPTYRKNLETRREENGRGRSWPQFRHRPKLELLRAPTVSHRSRVCVPYMGSRCHDLSSACREQRSSGRCRDEE